MERAFLYPQNLSYRRLDHQQDPTTRECLTMELGQLLCMIRLLVEQKVVNEEDLMTYMELKKKKLEKWSSIFKDAS